MNESGDTKYKTIKQAIRLAGKNRNVEIAFVSSKPETIITLSIRNTPRTKSVHVHPDDLPFIVIREAYNFKTLTPEDRRAFQQLSISASYLEKSYAFSVIDALKRIIT